jgi:hypothetical protein
MADTKKDAFDELGLESGAFEALERDFQQVRATPREHVHGRTAYKSAALKEVCGHIHAGSARACGR